MSTEIQKTDIQDLAGQSVKLVIPDTKALAKLETMDEKFSLTMKYKTADDWAVIKGQEVRCYFVGLKEVSNEHGEAVVCGLFVAQKECFIAGGLTLVEAVRNLPPQTPISITYGGKRPNKSSKGDTMIFDVKILG